MESLAKKISKGNFDLDDFSKQLKQMGKMGGVSGILSMLPGVSKAQKLMAENKISDSLINIFLVLDFISKHEWRGLDNRYCFCKQHWKNVKERILKRIFDTFRNVLLIFPLIIFLFCSLRL